ncbi:MAG: GNAT family N-acetyltransferase [bacterium]
MGQHEMKFVFRKAGSDDLTDIRGLLSHLEYATYSTELSSVYESLLKDDSYQCILALAPPDYEVVGMVTLRTFAVLRLAGYQTSIEELVVLPKWRGLGLGRALVTMAVEAAKKSGSVRLEVISSENRESTRRMFYEKAGLKSARSRIYRLDISRRTDKPHQTKAQASNKQIFSGELA